MKFPRETRRIAGFELGKVQAGQGAAEEGYTLFLQSPCAYA
jgi:hypothetical protein